MTRKTATSEKLDEMFLRWQEALEQLQTQQLAVETLKGQALEQEARFKGAIEALGGSEWTWDGAHVRIVPVKRRVRKGGRIESGDDQKPSFSERAVRSTIPKGEGRAASN